MKKYKLNLEITEIGNKKKGKVIYRCLNVDITNNALAIMVKTMELARDVLESYRSVTKKGKKLTKQS